MKKKMFILLFIISIVFFIGCKKFTTAATVEKGTGTFKSIDPILGQDYKLQVEVAANTISIAILDNTDNVIGEAETIDKLYKETGGSNFSFQTGVMTGNFSVLTDAGDQIKISFVRNTPPYLNVKDIICTQ